MQHTLLALTLAAAFGTAQASSVSAQTRHAADHAYLIRAAPTPVQPKLLGTTSTLPSLEIVQSTPAIPLSYRATDAAAQQWLTTGIATGLVGTNGSVMYAYGQSHPTLTCAPLHICTITLLEGEHVTTISIGDSVRWLVQATTAGNQPVVIVKPTEAGLVTNLVITTDQGRVYYLTLASRQADYVPLVGFYDPQKLVINLQQAAAQAAAAEKAKADARKQAVVAPLGRVDPAALDFDYACTGDDDLKPVRVFAGAGHTYLQMPAGMKDTNAPAVFNTSNGTTELMNSRLVHDYYLVDGLPARFKLVLGVGSDARSVECTHGKPGSGWSGVFN
jgi:P-type conjugative transfer protein TrbG